MSAPTITELENLLSEIKPRPTPRLQQKLQFAPWHTEEEKFSMIRLRKLELLATGAAVLLLAVITGVLFLQWSPTGQSTQLTTGPGSNQTAENETNSPQTENNTAPLPTRLAPTIPTPAPSLGQIAWDRSLLVEPGGFPSTASGLAYETNADQGRLFVANGYQGIQTFSLSGERLGNIAITDPETDQLVFVHDVAWSKLLWLGSAENEYGLFVLTAPFESGEYLHIINPDNKTILQSLTLNNNIAVPMTTDLVSELPPTHLSASGEGELYVDRVLTFASEVSGDPTTSLHYLLRSTIDGRILNPMLASQEPTNEERPHTIAALTYQPVTDRLYAAVHQGNHGLIQKFTLTGTPRNLATLNQDLTRWQEDVALSVDSRGLVYVLVDTPGYIVELDQEDQVVNVYGFLEMAGHANYPAVTYWLPGQIGRPLAMAVTPDGSMIIVIDQKGLEIHLTAYNLTEPTTPPQEVSE
jgi:hypothetical protein